MIQKEKQLLLVDLYARLPYNVKVNYNDLEGADYTLSVKLLSQFPEEKLKPYLRPMSSMTEEERNEYNDICQCRCHEKSAIRLTTLCYSHHLDINGLIEKGLALEAPADMYC